MDEERQAKKKKLAALQSSDSLQPRSDWPPDRWPKVLVCCPTYDGKDYALKEYMSAITGFDYPNYDIVLSDNSARRRGPFFKRLDSYPKGNAGVKQILSARRSKTTRESITKSRNQLLDFFRKGGYEFMMSVEFDLMPPPSIIKDLLQYGVPVITALYEIGYDHKPSHLDDVGKYPLIHMAVREGVKTAEGGTFMNLECPHCKEMVHVKNRTRQLTREELDSFIDGGVKRVHGCGMGCTLISATALAVIEKFRFDLQYLYHDDTYFYLDLWNQEVPVYIHTGFNITHDNSDWQTIKDF